MFTSTCPHIDAHYTLTNNVTFVTFKEGKSTMYLAATVCLSVGIFSATLTGVWNGIFFLLTAIIIEVQLNGNSLNSALILGHLNEILLIAQCILVFPPPLTSACLWFSKKERFQYSYYYLKAMGCMGQYCFLSEFLSTKRPVN